MEETYLKSLPGWARQMVTRYYTKTITQFTLYGNVHDLVAWQQQSETRFMSLKDFLGEAIFGSRDIVMFYDRSSGIQFLNAEMRRDFTRAVTGYDSYYGTNFAHSLPRDPRRALHLISSYLQLRTAEKKSIAVILDFAETIIPNTDPSMMGDDDRNHLVTLLKWSQDTALIHADATICLITENLGAINQVHVQSPYTEEIQILPPTETERLEYIEWYTRDHDFDTRSDISKTAFAKLTAGLNRISLRTIMAEVFEHQLKLTTDILSARKKELIEAECFGLLEFIETAYNLDMVAGHDGVKERFRGAAKAIKQGTTDVLPMGYLIAGPIGTGKTFITLCFAGEIGIPCVELKNFRSQWVGQTESNLEKILTILKAMAPIGVIIDEADAYLGTRSASGDSGVSARVFSKIASFMGNTTHRGKIIWFLMTSRPDLLPVDLKRQGRAEEHFALFYPESIEERKTLFKVMCKKTKVNLAKADIFPGRLLDTSTRFSGADIEAGLIRARFQAVVAGRKRVKQSDLDQVFDDFIPASYPLEIELQSLVAAQECTSRALLPEEFRAMPREEMSRRINELKFLIESRRT